MRNIMENRRFELYGTVKEGKRFNLRGSEVVDGYACKPKKLDPTKPIMHYKSHLLLCEGDRCKKACKDEHLADTLRGYLKESGHIKGASRIKVSRANCFGACRFRQVAVIFENTQANGYAKNNNIFLKNVHQFNQDRWSELFTTLNNNEPLQESSFELVPMQALDNE